ncbi:MAG: hypothetical protein EOR33_26885 [Mesorhizobium sp.]|nr:hypothetical protein EOA78_33060 [Mesorhizobium sp. M5C.F.Cr.IN.023.01.1.1]RWA98226.1 MAG: hypothetical protein EOQ33_28135 [Mesorhizobium sp.]RWE91661.1 MAG: hypothetical protein EOS43_32220 [Mesorhizobium sp.]RWJ06675.1 MAG: hypothetical protein EOR24_25230 [Mesorhizobium sp.]RWJ11874.1 MAG: hypothetical protein EOR25_30525 [Mesorhizobium sp.]
MFLLRFPKARTGPVPALPRARTDRTGGMTGASGSGPTEASMEGLRPSRAPSALAQDAGLPCRDRFDPAAPRRGTRP